MGNTQKIRAAIKLILEPVLAAEGFSGRYPHFQREKGQQLHVVSLVHDKWGGGFVLEFARMPLGDLTTDWGQVIPQTEIEIGYCALDQRARLVCSGGGGVPAEDFFRYAEIAESRVLCQQLVQQVVDLFPQVDAWLCRDQVGPNIAEFAPTRET